MNKMQLAVVAAAAAAFCGAVQAQASNVTVYGRVDLGVRKAPVNLLTSGDTATSLADSSTGRIGFMGTEDLGGGNSAYFQLEHRFLGVSGMVDGNVFWKDKAWVGLASKTLGKVQLGRQSSPADNLGVNGRFEAFGGDSYAGNGSRTARGAAKWDGAVYYTTPKLAGFTGGLAMAPRGSAATRHDAAGFHLDYAMGKLVLATTYQVEQDAIFTTASNSMKTATLAGAYDLGFVRPSFTYARTNDLGQNDQGSSTVFTVGARIPAGPGEARVSFRRIDEERINNAGTFAGDRDSDRLGIGYHYPLSKRTSINLSAVREQLKSFNAAGAQATDFSANGYEVAVRHNF
ncbi:porin [Caldimonas tepidiphila]|uniref:porin n=1 Tax=Caldimonas tepidiphila TaxID=2315841 RepID=UPI000E5BC76E|nr:porin [Caldimonas tepidiphila]